MIVRFCLALLSSQPEASSAPAPAEPPPPAETNDMEGYEIRRIEGWRVIVSAAFLRDAPALAGETLELLEHQLFQIRRMVPAEAVGKLRQVAVWVEEKEPHHACMAYHPSAGWLRDHGMEPRKARCIEIANARNFLTWTRDQPWMVLHELAHAYHDQFLGGYGNPDIAAAYRSAMDAKKYAAVLHTSGRTQRAYAANNPMEYFAEASEAYFGANDFYPFVRAELRSHDPELFALLEKLWGSEGASGKRPPAVQVPDWKTWKGGDASAKAKMTGSWRVLIEARPDRRYDSSSEEERVRKAVDAAYEALESDPAAACAAGVEILAGTRDDFERLMISGVVSDLDKKRGRPFLVWAMTEARSPDLVFTPTFHRACELADERDPKLLPALFLILRAHEGQVFLALHSWYIPLHEAMFYVFGRYGRDAIPYLRPMLEHADPYVRRNAAFALGFFGDEKAKPAFLKMLEARDIGSGGAAFALGEIKAVEALEPISGLLTVADGDTRFWAAYALYELGSKEALPALKKALASETHERARMEMEVTIEHLESESKPYGNGARKLSRAELREALDAAEKANGLEAEIEEIAASVTVADLERLEAIRRKTMEIPSDLGNRMFRGWTLAIKVARRRR